MFWLPFSRRLTKNFRSPKASRRLLALTPPGPRRGAGKRGSYVNPAGQRTCMPRSSGPGARCGAARQALLAAAAALTLLVQFLIRPECGEVTDGMYQAVGIAPPVLGGSHAAPGESCHRGFFFQDRSAPWYTQGINERAVAAGTAAVGAVAQPPAEAKAALDAVALPPAEAKALVTLTAGVNHVDAVKAVLRRFGHAQFDFLIFHWDDEEEHGPVWRSAAASDASRLGAAAVRHV